MIEAIASLPDVAVGVVTLDAFEYAPASIQGRMAAHWRVDDVLDPAQLLWAVRSLAGQHGLPTRLFGAYEQLQVPLAEARAELGIPGMSVETALDFRDKSRMKDVLRRAGLPCARHALAESVGDAERFAAEVGLPLVVKPPAGAGAQATYRAATPAALREAVARSAAPGRPVLLEEFMNGREHSLETVSLGGRAVWQSLTRYDPTPLEVVDNAWIQWSVVLPRETMGPEYADIREAGGRALDALGMETGLTHMEWFRRLDGSLAISEVAARPPGAQITTLVSRANDIDFVQAWARVMVFGEFDVPEQRYAVGCAYLRGQGGGTGGRVRAVHGLDVVWRELGELITDARIPSPGQPASASYEGEGYVIVRHPETGVVEDAVRRIVSVVRVEMG